MKTNEFDYYLIKSDANYDSPLLCNNDDEDEYGTDFLDDMEPVEEGYIAHLDFNPPIPSKPDMTDYLWLESREVFSKKIYDVLKDIEIKDFQLVPAVIKGKKGKEYTDYWIANIYREFAFLDENKSVKSYLTSDGNWDGIEKMVINQNVMSQVPLEERLVYVSKENCAYVFYHKSVVDAIMAVNPTGIVFIAVEKWRNY